MLEKDFEHLTANEAKNMSRQEIENKSQEEDEPIRVFCEDDKEPKSLAQIEHSIISKCANQSFKIFRLYVVYDRYNREEKIQKLKSEVQNWDKE